MRIVSCHIGFPVGYHPRQMTLAFLRFDPTGLWVLGAIIVALLIAIVGALFWRLYNKVPPDLRDKSKKEL